MSQDAKLRCQHVYYTENAPDQTNKQEQDDSADRGAQNCEHVTGAQMNA